MQTFKRLAKQAQQQGYRKGESAKQWHKRNPQAAAAFAEIIKANESQLIREMSQVIA